MGFLEDNQIKEIRYEGEGFKVFQPTECQLEELETLLNNQEGLRQDEGISIKGEVDSSIIRFCIKEFTSIGYEIDEYDDEKLERLISNGNRKIVLLMREIEYMVNEILEDIQHVQYQTITFTKNYIHMIETNVESENMNNKLNKLLKKHGLPITAEEFNKIKDNPKAITKIIKESKKKIKK